MSVVGVEGVRQTLKRGRRTLYCIGIRRVTIKNGGKVVGRAWWCDVSDWDGWHKVDGIGIRG